jgi:methionyl aminopeptidase
MVEIKNQAALDAMREAGRVVARALGASRDVAAPGVTLLELDEAAHAVIREADASSPFLNYHPSAGPATRRSASSSARPGRPTCC